MLRLRCTANFRTALWLISRNLGATTRNDHLLVCPLCVTVTRTNDAFDLNVLLTRTELSATTLARKLAPRLCPFGGDFDHTRVYVCGKPEHTRTTDRWVLCCSRAWPPKSARFVNNRVHFDRLRRFAVCAVAGTTVPACSFVWQISGRGNEQKQMIGMSS